MFEGVEDARVLVAFIFEGLAEREFLKTEKGSHPGWPSLELSSFK